ncbi:collagen alpha-1(I) chain-like [Canis lupus familiaris]|uniref:collagen alpha-1(I) chain-like n=1 Tax=Canis lupus familiaris TaxID=9615 RepID=UPI0018F6A961|nr:collagen alpha-1(I) chain-like [Canis lupus familiaris]
MAAAARPPGRGTGTPGGRAGGRQRAEHALTRDGGGAPGRARTPPRHRGDARGAADGQRRAAAGDPTHARGTRAPGRGRGRRGGGRRETTAAPSSPHNANRRGAGASGGRGREGRSGPGKRRAPRGARHRVGKTDDGRGRLSGKAADGRRPGGQGPARRRRTASGGGGGEEPRATARGFREASEGTREAEVGRPGGARGVPPPEASSARAVPAAPEDAGPAPPGGPQATSRGSGAPNRHRSRDRFLPRTLSRTRGPTRRRSGATGSRGGGGLRKGEGTGPPERSGPVPPRGRHPASPAPAWSRPPRGESSPPPAARRRAGPPRGGGEGRSPRTRAFGKGRRECPRVRGPPVPPAPRGKKAGGRGRAGVRTTPNPGARPPRTRHDGRARRSRGGRGPRAEREERSHPPWTPVPRLTRLRPGPGEHEITTSIDRQQAAAPRGLPEEQKPSEDGDRGDLLPPHRQAPRPPGGGGAGATGQPQTQRGTPDTRHGALRDRGCHGQRPGAHGMERTGVKDPPPPAHTALPRVPETGGRHRDPGHLESSTRAGAQAQADGSGSSERGQGPARPRGQARNPTRAQRPTSLRRATDGPAVFYVCLSSVCLSPKHNVSAPTWQQKMFISGKKITAPAGGDQPQVTATSRDRDTANCPQNLPHGAPPPPPHGAPRAIWSTQGTGGGGGGGAIRGRWRRHAATPPRRHAATRHAAKPAPCGGRPPRPSGPPRAYRRPQPRLGPGEVEGHARQRQPHRESPPGPDARTDGPPTPAWHPVRPPGTHLRSGPRKKGRKSRPTPGTPTRARSRVCRATHGLPLQAQTGPRRQGVTTGDNRVTRKEGPKIARSHRTDGGTHPVPRPRGGPGRSARAEEEPPAGAGRPTQAARTASSGSEAEATAATAATATLPRSSGGPISGERIARRGPGDSRTLAPDPPSSWNWAPGETDTKAVPCLSPPSPRRGHAL